MFMIQIFCHTDKQKTLYLYENGVCSYGHIHAGSF